MGRRSLISIRSIERYVASMEAKKRREEKIRLINSQRGISGAHEISWSLNEVNFSEKVRIARVDFVKSEKYRKIIKYVTHNYHKYPIYGGERLKETHLIKTVKLTNEVLENLENYQDDMIAQYAYEIICQIDNPDLYPSWFLYELLKNDAEFEMSYIQNKYDSENQKSLDEITSLTKNLDFNRSRMTSLKLRLNELYKHQSKLEKKVQKAKNKKHIVAGSLLTFGAYYLFHSGLNVKRLNRKLNRHNILVGINEESLHKYELENKQFEERIKYLVDLVDSKEKEKNEKLKQIKEEYDKKVAQVTPLPTDVDEIHDDSFIPLKSLYGINQEKIIGCFVIRNTEKDKYYVGQSKDILKRIKQLFDGTRPKTDLFAEDYYTSKIENKDKLFEVKIIRLYTKDELDDYQRKLIAEYDAFKSGYNKTSGAS